MSNLRNRLIHIAVGYTEIPGSPIKTDDENGLLAFLRGTLGTLRDGHGNELTDEQALYILETSGVGSLYDLRTGLYSPDGKAISTRAELAR